MKYTYTKITNVTKLMQEIRDSAITVALDYIEQFGEQCDVYFKAELSLNEQTILSDIITTHDSSEIPHEEISVQIPHGVTVNAQPPFAEPTFRTKHDATDSIITVVANEVKYVDYLMTDEKYVSGGELIVENNQFGDWVCAAVYDRDGVIPEAYRSAMCENWPVVAQYIIKKWVPTSGHSLIDTYPLNAKIPAGLCLRVGYHASSEIGTRKVAMNYHLTKKL